MVRQVLAEKDWPKNMIGLVLHGAGVMAFIYQSLGAIEAKVTGLQTEIQHLRSQMATVSSVDDVRRRVERLESHVFLHPGGKP